MKNPIIVTVLTFIISSILILVLAFLMDWVDRTGGKAYFLTTIGYGIFFQAIICYIIFILSSIVCKDWIDNRANYIIFALLMTVYLIIVLLPIIMILFR